MNTIRAKLILCWLLIAAYGVVFSCHHCLIAQFFILPAVWLVRIGVPRPKAPKLIQRIAYAFAGAFILFLVLVLIHSYDPFPAWALQLGMITGVAVGILILLPLMAYSIYSEYTLFKNSPNSRV